jgi:hypothetical protein
MFQNAPSALIFTVLLCAVTVLPDATVVQSGSPTFPLQVDKLTLSVFRSSPGKKGLDSATVRLPLSLYAELRDNIDTVFTYADALRRRRPELSPHPADRAAGPCLTIEYMGLWVMRLYFQSVACKSGRLIAAVDRYPFVVVLTRGFAARMKKLIKTGPK